MITAFAMSIEIVKVRKPGVSMAVVIARSRILSNRGFADTKP